MNTFLYLIFHIVYNVVMNKFLKEEDTKKAITVYTLSGILIALAVILLLNLAVVKSFFGKLLSVLSPFIWGILFAIITNKMANFIERHLPNKYSLKTRRFIGALVAVLVLVVTVVLVVYLLIPKLDKYFIFVFSY